MAAEGEYPRGLRRLRRIHAQHVLNSALGLVARARRLGDASALDAEHALLSDAECAGMLRNGSLTLVRVCPLLSAMPSVPPFDDAVDCAEAVGHSHLGIVKVRTRRLDYPGEPPSGG